MQKMLFSLCLAAVVVGCGGPPSDQPDLGSVSGKVTVGGEPLANAQVTFTPTGEGRPSSDVTDSSGNYDLQYTLDSSGAAIGEHVVTIGLVADEEDYESDNADESGGLPPAASDRSIKKTVEAGSNTIDIELSRSTLVCSRVESFRSNSF